MSSFSGVNYANTQALPIEQIEQGQYNAPVLVILDQYVMTGDFSSNDTLLVGGLIPEGATLLGAKVQTGALGGSAAINFGYQAGPAEPTGSPTPQAADTTAFFSALPCSSATYASAFGSTYQGDFYTQVALTSQVQPVITCSVATSGASGKKIFIEISYSKSGG